MSQEQTSRASDEAAKWMARMLRSDAESFKADFESWLRADREHAEAYHRLRRHYERSAVLADSTLFSDAGQRRHRRWLGPASFGVGAALAGLAAAVVMLFSFTLAFTALRQPTDRWAPSATASLKGAAASSYEVASAIGDIRPVTLPDGSKVTLDSGARLTVAYDGRTRFMTLLQGRARFDVRHEARPFIVAAGGGDVTAHGTVFDVEVAESGKIHVALLRGAIAVRAQGARADPAASRELTAGQSTDFDPAGFVAPTQPLVAREQDWPDGAVDVDAAPLAELLRQANRYTTTPIEVAPDLANQRVSGRFRINRPDLLVQNLADLLGLGIDRSQPGRIVLRKNIQTGAGPA